jgi:hypothetical protein
MDKDFLVNRIAKLKNDIDIGAGQLNQMIGRLQELEEMLRTFDAAVEKVEDLNT